MTGSSLRSSYRRIDDAKRREDMALMRILDGSATPEDHEAAANLLKKVDNCTCKMFPSEGGYQRSGVKCPECVRLEKFEIFKGF